MEKLKGNRPNQASAKSLPTDSKKSNQDALGGKQWPRGGKRREPAAGSFASKSDASRKPPPQKSRAFDKRPRARGTYIGGNDSNAVGGMGGGGSRLDGEDLQPELGPVFMQGSKKQSLNYLLNFHYTPRENAGAFSAGRSPNVHHKWLTTGKHKYNKEHFIQANCQFIVNSSGNYRQYMNNPDALVDWSLIEQINLQVNETPSCPICLYPPAAAKMTRCGHIYCWSCILHYLALSEKSWSKCPICYEAIHRQDLKSVVAISHQSFNVNETIVFKLMKRARGSLIAYPMDEQIRQDETLHVSDLQASSINCKLLIANNNDIMSIIEREKCELQVHLDEQIDVSETCFLEEAITKLQERENVLLSSLTNANNTKTPMETNRERFESFNSDLQSSNGDETEALAQAPEPAVATKFFYFYQASDGQHIYLHSVNVRMLEHTYGSLEFSPKTLTGRIIEKEGGSMTEELRNRMRYLQHMPVTCQFEVAEIQLHSSVVARETADEFADQLELRKRRRQKRAREEKRREKRIAEEENRQMGKVSVANIELESQVQFPEFGSSPINVEKSSLRQREISESTSRSASPVSMNLDDAGLSFAKMLGTKEKPSWPQLTSSLSSSLLSVSSPRLINVTGSKMRRNATAVHQDQESDEADTDDRVPVPAYNRSFSDAIAMALEKASLSNDPTTDNGTKGGQKNKKKKNKQKVLFATSMAYCGN